MPRPRFRFAPSAFLFSFTSLASVAVLGGCGGSKGVDLGNPDDGGAQDATSNVDGGGDDGAVGPDGATDAGTPDAIAPGNGNLLLTGKIVTPDAIVDGQVLVVGSLITCVQPGTACAGKPEAAGAAKITGSVISPGLIDTHNHILYDVFDDADWLPQQVYQDHTQWPSEARYGAMLDVKQCLANDSQGKPGWCANTPYGTPAGSLRCEMDKWGELKGLIAGTTSIVGLPGTSAACFGSLARSIDVAQNGLGVDKVQASALFPPSNPSGVCTNFTSLATTAFLAHVGEGTNAKALSEFATFGSSSTPADCLYAPQTAITHGTAFTQAEFKTMADKGMKLTWSPASNVALYGQTAQIPVALDQGLTIALAPDWSMGGSQNLLDELRFADTWDNKNFGDRLKAKDLVTMATLNGAKVLALDDRIGRIKEGYVADLVVFSGDANAPYDAIVAATPKEVRLVVIGGIALYGDKDLEPAAPATPGCESIDICGAPKFLCVATNDGANKLNQTYATIKAALEKAMTDADAQTTGDGFTFAPLAPLVKCK
jgi:5-methylthioadenosine/S-adenosylhomocysteine deaminase